MINSHPRLRWRVLVRTGSAGKLDPSKPSRPLSWHLVTCADTGLATAIAQKAAACWPQPTIPLDTACSKVSARAAA